MNIAGDLPGNSPNVSRGNKGYFSDRNICNWRDGYPKLGVFDRGSVHGLQMEIYATDTSIFEA